MHMLKQLELILTKVKPEVDSERIRADSLDVVVMMAIEDEFEMEIETI
jgi:acyl carrier protein